MQNNQVDLLTFTRCILKAVYLHKIEDPTARSRLVVNLPIFNLNFGSCDKNSLSSRVFNGHTSRIRANRHNRKGSSLEIEENAATFQTS